MLVGEVSEVDHKCLTSIINLYTALSEAFIKQNSGDYYCFKADGRTSLQVVMKMCAGLCSCPLCEWLQLHVLCVSSSSNSDLCSQLIVFACLCFFSKVNMKQSFYSLNLAYLLWLNVSIWGSFNLVSRSTSDWRQKVWTLSQPITGLFVPHHV